MSLNKIFLLTGLCVFLTACSTGGSNSFVLPSDKKYTSTNKGVRYLLGRGVKQNDEKAFYYFNQGANEGDVFAQNELAFLYAAGKGTSKNYRQSLYWYQKAADHDLASAQYNLGVMYLHGIGTEPNKKEGLRWLRKSAAHGFEPAHQVLAFNRF